MHTPSQEAGESHGWGLFIVLGAAVISNRQSRKEDCENGNIVYLLNK